MHWDYKNCSDMSFWVSNAEIELCSSAFPPPYRELCWQSKLDHSNADVGIERSPLRGGFGPLSFMVNGSAPGRGNAILRGYRSRK